MSTIFNFLSVDSYTVNMIIDMIAIQLVIAVIYMCYILYTKKWKASNKELALLTVLMGMITFYVYRSIFASISEVCVPTAYFWEVCVYPEKVANLIGFFAMLAYIISHLGVVEINKTELQIFNGKQTGEKYGEGIKFLPSPGLIIKKILYVLHLPLFYEKH